jgi:ABC-type uncharacterized transport system permease subunit
MPDLDLLPVLAAAAAAFVIVATYDTVFGTQLAATGSPAAEQRPPWKLAVELGRCLILATVVAGLASQGEPPDAR